MRKPLQIPLRLSFFFLIAVQVFNFLNPNGSFCCIHKHAMLLFVDMGEIKSKGHSCLTAQNCSLRVGCFPASTTWSLIFCQQRHIYSYIYVFWETKKRKLFFFFFSALGLTVPGGAIEPLQIFVMKLLELSV